MTTQQEAAIVSASTEDSNEGGAMNESVIPADDVDRSVEEAIAVHAWRADQLRRLGLPSILADTFADEVDWHSLSALIERGCPLGLAFEIVR
jgi:hypothetical protein